MRLLREDHKSVALSELVTRFKELQESPLKNLLKFSLPKETESASHTDTDTASVTKETLSVSNADTLSSSKVAESVSLADNRFHVISFNVASFRATIAEDKVYLETVLHSIIKEKNPFILFF